MDLVNSTTWCVITAALVIIELVTGTLYCLAIAAGTGAGAVAAWAGASEVVQICAAAAVSLVATSIVTRIQRQRRAATRTDVGDVVGQLVSVVEWTSEFTARVKYRGTDWDARLAEGAPSGQVSYRIAQQDGNTLIIH